MASIKEKIQKLLALASSPNGKFVRVTFGNSMNRILEVVNSLVA